MIYTFYIISIYLHETNKINDNFLDTEEASETDMGERKSEEYTEIKEQ